MELLVDIKKPGYCFSDALTMEQPGMIEAFISFMFECDNVRTGKYRWKYRCLDIGNRGHKSEVMQTYFPIHQGLSNDFNFYPIEPDWRGVQDKYKVITCFETIEHIQNPLTFVTNIKQWLHPDGSLFISTPCRPRFLWTTHHFFEMDGDHMQKWLFNPLDLQIVRKKKVRIPHHWSFYFKGIRPFFRLFFGYTWVYEIRHKKSIL